MAEMTSKAMRAFLRGKHVATFVTLKPDGSPHATPVWYGYDGRHAFIFVGTGSVKARNLRRDQRAVLCVANQRSPYRAVILEGTARFARKDRQEIIRSMSIRYLGPKEGGSYAREVLEGGGTRLIRLTPTKILSWDYGTEE